MARLVSEFENAVGVNDVYETQDLHHEENPQFQKTFYDDVQKAISAMECNPFEMDKLTAINNTRMCFNDIVYQHISKIELVGKEQCCDFIEKRLARHEIAIDSKITKNNFSLPGCPERGVSKTKGYSSVNIDSTLLTKLRASSYRRNEVSNVFSSEINGAMSIQK